MLLLESFFINLETASKSACKHIKILLVPPCSLYPVWIENLHTRRYCQTK